jgi:outer membrane protein
MTSLRFYTCLAAMLASAPAFAQQQNLLRIAVEDLTLHSKASNLSSNGPAFLTPQPAGIDVGNDVILQIVYTRRLNAHWDFDLQFGTPPKLNVRGTGALAPFGVLASFRQAGPSAFITYNFGEVEDRFRPFIGLGVNYSRFYDATTTASGRLASGGPTRINASESFGPAAKIGASWRLGERWYLVGAIGTAKVKTDITAVTGSIERKTTVDLRPLAYTLGVAYSF